MCNLSPDSCKAKGFKKERTPQRSKAAYARTWLFEQTDNCPRQCEGTASRAIPGLSQACSVLLHSPWSSSYSQRGPCGRHGFESFLCPLAPCKPPRALARRVDTLLRLSERPPDPHFGNNKRSGGAPTRGTARRSRCRCTSACGGCCQSASRFSSHGRVTNKPPVGDV